MEAASGLITMDVLFALTLLLALQAKTEGRSMQEYCTTFVNSTVLNGSDCHSRCAECFGPDVDQCYECVGGTRLDIEELCQNTTVAEDVMNIPDSFELLDCSAEEDNSIIIIAGAAGGGGVVLLCCFFLVCCCCCCYCKRKRRKKLYTLQNNEETMYSVQALDIGSITEAPVKERETPMSVDRDFNTSGGGEFQMQLNLAMSDDSIVRSPDSPLKLTPAPVSTSANNTPVKNELGERKAEDRLNSTASVGAAGEKGYVKMSSAGSVRNLNSSPEGDEIYMEPDLTLSVIVLSKATPTSPAGGSDIKHVRPATLPKPSALQKLPPPKGPPPVLAVADNKGQSTSHKEGRLGSTNVPQASQNEARKSQSSSHGKEGQSGSHVKEGHPDSQSKDQDSQCEDDYESPAVFTEDLKKQQVEDYYNKDAVLFPDKALKPDATRSSGDSRQQTLYANLADTLNIDNSDNDDDQSDKASYESVNRYLGGDGGEDPGFYYNVPDLGREVNDDNMYVYMKSGLTTEQRKAASAKVKDRQRATSEQGSKKYVNYSREQQQARLAKLGKENGIEAREGDPSEGGGNPSEEDGPLYANCRGEEEELYSELS